MAFLEVLVMARRFKMMAPLMMVTLLVAGCGDGHPKRVAVSGQVKVDGKPLTCGSVRFLSPGNRASTGVIDKDGRFTLSCYGQNDGAVPGDHKVEVLATEMVTRTLMRWHAPKKYQDQSTSGLTQTITEPTDKMQIELTWAGGKPFDEPYYASGADYKEVGKMSTPEQNGKKTDQ
jgi:hypothetical protein